MVEISDIKIMAIEDSIRDIINVISVRNNEEIEGGTKKIEDETAKELTEKLRETARKIGLAGF